MTARVPLVGVLARRLPIGKIDRWLEPAVALPSYYVDALHRAGAVGVLIAPQAPGSVDAAGLVARLDGLVLTGGPDLDPSLYGEEPHPATYGADAGVDGWERGLLDAATAADLPVLGICRGAQILNVVRGGTLVQHVPELVGEGVHGIPAGGGGAPNTIELTPGSKVAEAFGATTVVGRCHHHQAVGEVAPGLVVTGRTADGVVEALEDPAASWLVAVQWHPEDTAMDDAVQQRLFDHFVGVVRHAAAG